MSPFIELLPKKPVVQPMARNKKVTPYHLHVTNVFCNAYSNILNVDFPTKLS
jgi:hypothetical protein